MRILKDASLYDVIKNLEIQFSKRISIIRSNNNVLEMYFYLNINEQELFQTTQCVLNIFES